MRYTCRRFYAVIETRIMSADHDKKFVRTFLGVLGILVAITFVIIIGAQIITGVADDGELSPAQVARIEAQTQPVYEVVTDPSGLQKVSNTDDAAGDEPKGDPKPGPEVYQAVCSACHDSGIAGAPKLSNTDEWSSRLSEQGKDQLYSRAINGYKGMPAKGGNPALSDQEVKNAVDHILSKSGAS